MTANPPGRAALPAWLKRGPANDDHYLPCAFPGCSRRVNRRGKKGGNPALYCSEAHWVAHRRRLRQIVVAIRWVEHTLANDSGGLTHDKTRALRSDLRYLELARHRYSLASAVQAGG